MFIGGRRVLDKYTRSYVVQIRKRNWYISTKIKQAKMYILMGLTLGEYAGLIRLRTNQIKLSFPSSLVLFCKVFSATTTLSLKSGMLSETQKLLSPGLAVG